MASLPAWIEYTDGDGERRKIPVTWDIKLSGGSWFPTSWDRTFNPEASAKLLADVYGCPIELVDDVVAHQLRAVK